MCPPTPKHGTAHISPPSTFPRRPHEFVIEVGEEPFSGCYIYSTTATPSKRQEAKPHVLHLRLGLLAPLERRLAHAARRIRSC